MTSNVRQLAGGKILAEVRDVAGIITFNQPEKRNAISAEMWEGVAQVLAEWENDPAIRVVVLTGAGDKAFVSGADISQFEKLRSDAEAQKQYQKITEPGRNRIVNFPKPVIAMVRGYCLGGGLAIAMLADFRIASSDSQFGIPAARMGIAYAFEAIRNLIALVGPSQARLLLYTARRIDAAEALRIGLVDQVVAPDALAKTVHDLAATMGVNAPLSMRASKYFVAQALRDPADRDAARMQQMTDDCFSSADYTEGRTAFMEKREPKFTGK
jgi:enoyl-CoA hydratase/carnithine racemase